MLAAVGMEAIGRKRTHAPVEGTGAVRAVGLAAVVDAHVLSRSDR